MNPEVLIVDGNKEEPKVYFSKGGLSIVLNNSSIGEKKRFIPYQSFFQFSMDTEKTLKVELNNGGIIKVLNFGGRWDKGGRFADSKYIEIEKYFGVRDELLEKIADSLKYI